MPNDSEKKPGEIQNLLRELESLRQQMADAGGSPAQADVWAFVSYYGIAHGTNEDPVKRHQKRKDEIIDKLEGLGLSKEDILEKTAPQTRRSRFSTNR